MKIIEKIDTLDENSREVIVFVCYFYTSTKHSLNPIKLYNFKVSLRKIINLLK